MPDTESKNDLGAPAGAGAIDPVQPSPNVLARLDALAERRNQPDIVAFLRNRAEDTRNDAKIMREHGEDGGEFDYLERNFDRAANSHHAMKEALDSIRQYGSDTLSGRVDGPDDRAWQREAVLEMTRRAAVVLKQLAEI